ncbi:hypothetical protein [Fluviicola sp.]|uniref:hypothetical protein n=1 Tax=Fluviicola sp. TaxID=1917219 RepID=UPI00262D6EFF|nr:hypothetical protein [Fluviicola sp.]
MKKILSVLVLCVLSGGAFSQTATFELNQEKARYNQTKNVSQIVSSGFTSSTTISHSHFTQIAAAMEQKDGYVSCTLTPQNELIISHENWLDVKDILDVIRQFVPVEHKKASTTETGETQHISK